MLSITSAAVCHLRKQLLLESGYAAVRLRREQGVAGLRFKFEKTRGGPAADEQEQRHGNALSVLLAAADIPFTEGMTIDCDGTGGAGTLVIRPILPVRGCPVRASYAV